MFIPQLQYTLEYSRIQLTFSRDRTFLVEMCRFGYWANGLTRVIILYTRKISIVLIC